MEEGAAKAPAAPSLRAAAKQSSVSFLDCRGAEAPRNDAYPPVRPRLPAFFWQKAWLGRTWHRTRKIFRAITENQ